MAIKIASWNIEGRLTAYLKGKRGTPRRILQAIEALDADVIVLPEAYLNYPSKGVDEYLRRLGYKWKDVAYEGIDREADNARWGMPHLRVLSRITLTKTERVRWGNVSNGLVCYVHDPVSGKEVRIVATHLDDRSEVHRNAQVQDIISYINKKTMPTVMLGDFNAMWPKGRARLLRSRPVRSIATRMPGVELRSVLTRLTDMATGDVLRELAAKTDLRDIDPKHRPTTTPKMRSMLFMPSVRLAQIDHILVSSDIQAENFKIGRDGGSDHRSVSTLLTTT